MLNDDDFDGYNPPRVESGLAIGQEKARQLCELYELYRLTHDADTAFRLAWGIEVEGLPF